MKRKAKERLGYAALNMAFVLLCAVTLVPILYAVSVSFSGAGASLSGDFSFIPEHPSFENYRAILLDEPFLLWLKNSLLLSAGTVLVAMLCAVMAAYACSRWRFRGRRPVLRALLVLNAFPQVLSLFAYYRILRLGGLLNSHAGLILIYAGSMCVFGIWNMKGYFDTIPVEIEEASKIDGASDAQMIWKIVLPLAKPGSSTADMQEEILLQAYAGADGSFTLYEDAGDGYGYEKGEYCVTQITYCDKERKVEWKTEGRTEFRRGEFRVEIVG